MARKLTFEEMRAYRPATDEQDGAVTDLEKIARMLSEKRERALQLSPESSQWFGDQVPGSFGFHW